jgi:DNA-binding transcriptional LysR family regulator
MELRHLRYFIAVAEEQNISRAAERLHLSQPPLTRQIQLLEQKVGTRLFDRSSTGVALTAAGRFFLEDARLILAMVTQAEERARSAGLGQIGRIDIAVFGSVMFDDLPQLLARFRDTHPRVEVVLHTLNKGDQIEALRQHRITIGFNRLTSNFTDIATTRLKAERLVIALHHSHPLAARKRLSLEDLEGCPLVLFSSGPRPNFTDLVFSLFQQLGLKPVVSQTVEDSVTGVALVAAGFGACLVPGSVSHVKLPGVVFIPLTKIPAGIVDLNCMYRKDDTSPTTMAFLETLKAFRSPIVDSVSH